MKDKTTRALRIGSKAGALAGGIIFLAVGIGPGFHFGSYATLLLLSIIAGGPVEPGITVRAVEVVGIIVGLFCTAMVSMVVGSVTGTALTYIAVGIAGIFKARPKAAA